MNRAHKKLTPYSKGLTAKTYPASFDQRLMAMTLDLLALAVVIKILEVLLKVSEGTSVGIFVFVGYFVLSQWWFGQTLGKRLLGLRVVSGKPRSINSFFNLLYRETLARGLSLLPACAGHWMILFSRDSRTLHDRLSQTEVTTAIEARSSFQRQFVRGALVIASLSAGFAAFAAYSLLWTRMPIENIRQRLSFFGVHMQGAKGTLVDGVEIDEVEWHIFKNRVLLRGVTFEVDPWSLIAFQEFLRLKHFRVASGEIEWVDPAAMTSLQTLYLLLSRGLAINAIDLADIRFKMKDEKFFIKRIYANDFWTLNGDFALARLFVDSEQLHLSGHHLEYRDGLIGMNGDFVGGVRKAFAPDFLKTDFGITLRVEGSMESPDFAISAFNSQLKMARSGERGSLEIVNWSPSNFFNGVIPISLINLKSEGDLGEWTDTSNYSSWSLDGDFRLAYHVVRLKKGQTIATAIQDGLKGLLVQSKERYELTLAPQFFDGEHPWLQINQEPDLLAQLAHLYRGQKFNQLPSADQFWVKRDASFFAKSLYGLEKQVQRPLAHIQKGAARAKQMMQELDDEDETDALDQKTRAPASQTPL